MTLSSSVRLGLIGTVVLTTVLSSCRDTPFYEKMLTYNGEWPAEDPAAFTFQIDDTTAHYRFLLNLRHTEAYRYSNLYLFMQLDFPNGKLSVDTLECVLADPKGRWTGKSSGNLVDHRIVLNPKAIFPLTGEYTVKITQAMRQDTLREIMDVGFSLESLKAEN